MGENEQDHLFLGKRSYKNERNYGRLSSDEPPTKTRTCGASDAILSPDFAGGRKLVAFLPMSPAHDSSSSSSSSSSASSDSDSEVEVRQPPPPKSFPDASRKRKRREVQDESAQGEGEGEGAGSETQGDALSHAALRRQKKKQKTMTTDATKPPTQSTTSQVRKNSVWVGNLSFKTTSNRLQEFFDGAGEVTRVHMPTKSAVGDGKGMRGENRG
jgi:hypothetical protein